MNRTRTAFVQSLAAAGFVLPQSQAATPPADPGANQPEQKAYFAFHIVRCVLPHEDDLPQN